MESVKQGMWEPSVWYQKCGKRPYVIRILGFVSTGSGMRKPSVRIGMLRPPRRDQECGSGQCGFRIMKTVRIAVCHVRTRSISVEPSERNQDRGNRQCKMDCGSSQCGNIGCGSVRTESGWQPSVQGHECGSSQYGSTRVGVACTRTGLWDPPVRDHDCGSRL